MKIKEKVKMLPCPFCGRIPTLHLSHFKYLLIHHCEAIQSAVGRGKKDEVIKIWNKRSDNS